jgi:hypothetical protein
MRWYESAITIDGQGFLGRDLVQNAFPAEAHVPETHAHVPREAEIKRPAHPGKPLVVLVDAVARPVERDLPRPCALVQIPFTTPALTPWPGLFVGVRSFGWTGALQRAIPVDGY